MSQKIISHPSTPEYEKSYERVFGKKESYGNDIIRPALQELIDSCDRQAMKEVFGV